MSNRKQRTLAIWALAIALGATSIAYAALQTTLSIRGSVTKKGGTWDIKLVDVSTSTVAGGSFSTKPSTSGTSLTFNANLNTEGDAISVKFRVHNAGTIAAKLSTSYNGLVLSVNNDSVAVSYNEYKKVVNGVTCGLYTENGSVVNYGGSGELMGPDSNTIGTVSDLFSLNAGAYSNYYTLKCEYTEQDEDDSSIPVKLTLNYKQA